MLATNFLFGVLPKALNSLGMYAGIIRVNEVALVHNNFMSVDTASNVVEVLVAPPRI